MPLKRSLNDLGIHSTLVICSVIMLQLIGNVISFETYYMDHEVTEKQAHNAIREVFNKTEKRGTPNFCDECTEEVNNYCLSQNLIQDHCCCDQAHGKENMPWRPHSCYMGKETCRPVAGSCMKYMKHRQCCCDKLWIEILHQEYSAAIETRPCLLVSILSIVMLSIERVINS